MAPDTPMMVECKECGFTRIIQPEDDVLPAEVVMTHGRDRAHQLRVSPFDEKRDTLTP